MAFPTSPTEGQIYKKYMFKNSAWKELTGTCVASKYRLSANYLHPVQSWTKMPFDLCEYGNLPVTFSPSLNRFTPVNKGVYRVSVSGYSNSNGGGLDPRYAIGIYKNGKNIGFTGSNLSTKDDSPLTGYTGLVQCNGTTDYFEIWSFFPIEVTLCGSSYYEPGHEMQAYIEYLGDQ